MEKKNFNCSIYVIDTVVNDMIEWDRNGHTTPRYRLHQRAKAEWMPNCPDAPTIVLFLTRAIVTDLISYDSIQ